MQSKISRKFISLLMVCALFFSITPQVWADDETIPASGEICTQGICNQIQITFPPKGGPVNGTLSGSGSREGCNFDNSGTIYGTFAGGDGGAISGTISFTMVATCGGNSISQNWSGSWQGTISASGTGSGSGNVAEASANWTLNFSADDFLRILITKEYFKEKYGLDVLDGKTAWMQNELLLLKKALDLFPANVFKKLKLDSIVREDVLIDEKGKRDPSTYGIYYPATHSINIFDSAWSDGASGGYTKEQEFLGYVVHEITHAYQFYLDEKTTYDEVSVYDNDFIKLFVFSTLDVEEPQSEEDLQTGWAWNEEKGRLVFNGKRPDNQLVSKYAGTNPIEDMAESARFFILDPEGLKQKSPNRYAFVRDYIFGGKDIPEE